MYIIELLNKTFVTNNPKSTILNWKIFGPK